MASRPIADKIANVGFSVCGILAVAVLLSIFIFLANTGLRAFTRVPVAEFFFSTNWNPTSYFEPAWGIGALALSTALITVTALAMAVPLGLICAIYLAEIASRPVRETLKPLIEMIAGVPSVTLGLIGLLYLAPLIAKTFGLSNGLNALTAAILVGIVAIPSIASVGEDALTAVPRQLRASSYALGASRWTTIWHITIPAARSGLVAAIMLGLGRIIGETMIVLMVAGNSRALPHSLFDPVRPMTANIAIEIKEVIVGSLHWQSLFAIGLILFVITFLINTVADVLIHKKS